MAAALLAIGWASIVVLLGWLLYPAMGSGPWIALGALTVIGAVVWRRRNDSWRVALSPQQNRFLLLIGGYMLAMWVVVCLFAATMEVWAPPQLIALLPVMPVCLIGVGLLGRRADR
ncbi:hypothetical protein [Actinoplanes cyaneus]|uniref:hypothetical protein n=1 Tax=Actinoplanes cyaneus TaxID=52696 RepID=UPI001943D252|nr:hypothetical protein [Actinoplanes cyaneus]